MDFNLEYYRSFFYAAKYGSISKAAEALYVSQPAVSSSIQKLENKLGCRLFQRVPHGVILTSEGEVLFHHVSEAFQAFEIGEQKVGRLAHYETGEMKIGTTETPLYQYLIPKLAAFQKRFPNIHMDITGCITSELWDYLKKGSIDMAFAVSPLPEEMDCRIYPLEEIQDVFIAGETFSHLRGTRIPLSELVTYPITYVSKKSSAGMYLTNWLKGKGISFQPQYTVRTSTLVLPMVSAGLSIGIVPKGIWENNRSNDHIFEIETEEKIPPRQIFLAVNEFFPSSAISREFISSILNGENV